jgi:hypothetical protein
MAFIRHLDVSRVFRRYLHVSRGSSNVRELVAMAVEYGVDRLDRKMTDAIVDTVRSALRRRYMTSLSMDA